MSPAAHQEIDRTFGQVTASVEMNPQELPVYSIDLPHQCDRWTVAYDQNRATVIEVGRELVADLTAAIDWLEAQP